MTSYMEDPPTPRRVWIAIIPDGDEYGVGRLEVLIEQFGAGRPTIAFRRKRHHTWSRPYETEWR